MNAMSHPFDLAHATMLPPTQVGQHETPNSTLLAQRWEAVHEAAAAVGNLAQLGREPLSREIMGLPERAAVRGGWHYDSVARGIDDLAAMMEPGLRALLSLTAQGQDTTAAALTLWREFHTARAAIVAILDAA
ncbi:hypothetical protein [Erythrobacter aureus]|uniref:hypothetical protein n=1 Tax=Erythrobacter aureus TaxID=2182384 RepID=UPI000C44A897|nr:hypothetical protein [Sphingomonadaceae bacterium]